MTTDDGFLEAMNASAENVWGDVGCMRRLSSLKRAPAADETEPDNQTERPDISLFSILKEAETGTDLVVQRIPSP